MSRAELLRFLVDSAASADLAAAWRADPASALAAYDLSPDELAALTRPSERWLGWLGDALAQEEQARPATPSTSAADPSAAPPPAPAPAHGPIALRLHLEPVGDGTIRLSVLPDTPGAPGAHRLRLSPWRTADASGFTGALERVEPEDAALGAPVDPRPASDAPSPWGHDVAAARLVAAAHPPGPERARAVVAALRRGTP